MDEDEDEDMPLLPRSRRRLLDKGEDDLSPGPPPSSLARGTRGVPSQTPIASQPPPRRTTATQRQLRETSVNSDTSSVGRSTRTRTTKAAPSTQTRKGRAPAIVIEESEDEVNRDLGPARSSTGTGTGTRGKSSKIMGVSGTGSGGGFGDDEASSMATGTATRGKTQSSQGMGRRRLVVDDDDDGEMVSRSSTLENGLDANELGVQGSCQETEIVDSCRDELL
jgi:hypothetical protein